MHEASMKLMREAVARYGVPGRADVLDVGSYDVNGTFRPLIEARGWRYTGIDIRPGPNVDVIAMHPYRYHFADGTFDVVMCGNTLHNVSRPWLLVKEMARVLRPGGLLAITTIWKWGRNSHPVDYFRFMPAGLEVLFDESGVLVDYQLGMDDDGNTVGSAFRKL